MDTTEVTEQDQTQSNTNAFVAGVAFVAIVGATVLVVRKVRTKLAARKLQLVPELD